MVTWSSFASYHDNPRYKFPFSLMLWCLQYAEVSVNYIEDVHKLSLILMYSLHLDIVDGIKWNVKASMLFYPCL